VNEGFFLPEGLALAELAKRSPRHPYLEHELLAQQQGLSAGFAESLPQSGQALSKSKI
jgi:hypothetical protein